MRVDDDAGPALEQEQLRAGDGELVEHRARIAGEALGAGNQVTLQIIEASDVQGRSRTLAR